MALSFLRGGFESLRRFVMVMRQGARRQTSVAAWATVFIAGTALSTIGVIGSLTADHALADASTCTAPSFSTSKADAGTTFGEYYVHNNMWNAGSYAVTQKLDACSAQKWNVTVTADNSKSDGAVKTYPNVHKDYHNWTTGAEPKIDAAGSLVSSFGAVSPHGTGQIYNVAYDIWLNGVPGNREIMIWTDNWKQTPAGNKVNTVQVAGQSWEFWATGDNHVLTFVAPQTMTSGSLDLKAFLDWLSAQGRIPADSTLGQIDYGVEVVSTNGTPATFSFTDFSIGGAQGPTTTPMPASNDTTSQTPAETAKDTETTADQEATTSKDDQAAATPATDTALPSTGPESVVSGLTGLVAMTYAATRYIQSRRLL